MALAMNLIGELEHLLFMLLGVGNIVTTWDELWSDLGTAWVIHVNC